MIKFEVILLVAGLAERCHLGYNKIFYTINDKPLYLYSLEKFLEIEECLQVIIVGREEELSLIEKDLPQTEKFRIKVVSGGCSRQESVLHGLKEAHADYVLIHDGARPCVSLEDIRLVLTNLMSNDNVTLATKLSECVRKVEALENKVLKRENLYAIKTPQGLKRELLQIGLEKANCEKKMFYDDCSVLEEYFSLSPKIVIGREDNIKVTTLEDIELVKKILGAKMDYRIGHSKDVHQLEKSRKMIIGGVEIESDLGIKAHSDGDVLYHAISEAIIGALGKGDLGTFFPDTSEKYHNVSSDYFMIEATKMLEKCHYEIQNLDTTIFIEEPMMAPYLERMKKNIAKLLKINQDQINIKATRGEKVGPIGERLAVASEAVIIIKKV